MTSYYDKATPFVAEAADQSEQGYRDDDPDLASNQGNA